MNGNLGSREYGRAMGARIGKLLLGRGSMNVVCGDSKAGHSNVKDFSQRWILRQ
jgi:hypothetical protein